jgi:hypothetical protein
MHSGSNETCTLRRTPTKTPVHFLHVRKTGGTAVIEALRLVADRYGIVLHEHATRLVDIPRDHFVMFFLRHPISRFVSGFYSRLRRGLPRHYYEWSAAETEAFQRFQTANELAEALYSSDYELTMQAQRAMLGIRHVKNTYKDWFSGAEEIEDRLDSLLYVGLQEELNSDFEQLKAILGLPPSVSLPSDGTLSHRTPTQFDRRLSPLAEQNLSRWYAEDIEVYNYGVRVRDRIRSRLRAASGTITP